MSLFGSLLSGGFSLLSGIGSMQAAKSQRRQQLARDYMANLNNAALGAEMVRHASPQAIVADANKAGFNPVTWLNAMGAGYSALRNSGYGMMTTQYSQVNSVPTWAGAIGAAGSAFMDNFNADARQSASQDFQMAYLSKQLDAIQKRSPRTSMLGVSAPVISSAGGASMRVATGSLSPGKVNKPEQLLGVYAPQADNAKVTNSGLFGEFTRSDPRWADGDSIEQEYGDNELVSMLYSVGKFGANAYRKATGRNSGDDMRLFFSRGGGIEVPTSTGGFDLSTPFGLGADRRQAMAAENKAGWRGSTAVRNMGSQARDTFWSDLGGAINGYFRNPGYQMPPLGNPLGVPGW